MNLLRRIQYSQNWNIGFSSCTEKDLLKKKSTGKVQWMKHPYKDRWFADPFIYKVTDSEIIVFVEECMIDAPKGILCELVLDKTSKRLKQRHVLLDIKTHLSYPAIFTYNGKTYVYPENGASGKLNIYEYNETKHCLENPKCIIDEALADSTIIQLSDSEFYLIATKVPEVQQEAYLYKADSLFGPFELVNSTPIQYDRSCSRPGGNWIKNGAQIFRPAQDCVARYGHGIALMKVDMQSKYSENKLFTLYSDSFRYNLGMHTLNFYSDNGDNLLVIDGYGYLHPYIGRLYYSKLLTGIKNFCKKLK